MKFQKAFTLAEVLITLGIIGVVAALTVPTLIQNYNTKAWNTAAIVFEKKLEDSLKIMNSQSALVGYATTEEFVEELSKHFKTNKICKNDELLNCFSDVVYWGGAEADPEEVDVAIIKTSQNIGQTEWKTNIVGVQFASGVSALIAYNPTVECEQDPHSNQVDVNKCFAILYDTTSEKNPNTIGKDLRANRNVTDLGTGCVFMLNGTCYTTTPFNPEPVTFAECQAMVASGLYGLKTCEYEQDYWAGAVKACNGKNNLPTLAQLAELSNYIYDTTDIGAQTTKNDIKMDETKMLSLGFKLSSSKAVSVWANGEGTSKVAYRRGFYSTSANWGSTSRNTANLQAICINK